MRLNNAFNEPRIYVNPDPEEIEELSKEMWDTVRITIFGKDIIVGSGFGHTHDTLIKAYRKLYPKSKFLEETWILYFRGTQAMMDDTYGIQAATYSKWHNSFIADHEAIIKDIIRERGLTL
jgi:hypothetical protein